MHCIEESTCDIVETFRCPQLFGAWGIVTPLTASLRPCRCQYVRFSDQSQPRAKCRPCGTTAPPIGENILF